MIYFINLLNISNIDKNILIEQLIKIGYSEQYLNDISFCPYLIIHKDFEDNLTPTYENINEGFLNKIKENLNIEEVFNIYDFISAAKSLLIKNNNINNLF